MGQDPTDEEVSDMLDILDFDQDGHLDIQEFLAFLRVQRRQAVAELNLKFKRNPVVVDTVSEDKAAAKAGVKPGFFLAAVGGVSITGLSLEQINTAVANAKSKGSFTMSFAKSEESLLKWLEEADANESVFSLPAFGTLGIELQVDSRRANCVTVGAVRPGTSASAIGGLVPGLIIKSIQGRSVRGLEINDVMEILRQEKSKAVQQGRQKTLSLSFVQLKHAIALEVCKLDSGGAPLGLKLKFLNPDESSDDDAVNLDAKHFDPRTIKVTRHRGQTLHPEIVLQQRGQNISVSSVSVDMHSRYDGLAVNSVLVKVASQPVSMLPLSEVMRLIDNVSQWANYIVEFRRPLLGLATVKPTKPTVSSNSAARTETVANSLYAGATGDGDDT